MFDRREAKRQSKKQIKKHYWIFTAVCLLISFWGIQSFFFDATAHFINLFFIEDKSFTQIVNQKDFPLKLLGYKDANDDMVDVFAEVAFGSFERGKEISEAISQERKSNPNEYFKNVKMEYHAGVFANVANTISSGHIFISAYNGICSIVGQDYNAAMIFIIISIIIIFILWACVINVYKVIYRRIFLEGFIYDKVHKKAFIHLIRKKKYFKAVRTMLLASFAKILWMFTIVGGFIKYFSYYMVPYIVAENPDISPVTALKLSKEMMRGHKMQCFKLKLSFILWDLLDFVTLGFAEVVFLNIYKEAFFTNYYVYIRKEAKEKHIENAELLNDDYLYKKADAEKLSEAYSDIYELSQKPQNVNPLHNKVWCFFANILGVVPAYSKREQEYFEYNCERVKIASYESVMQGEVYPDRLNAALNRQKHAKLEFLNYRRHYSICSLIMIFFVISFAGWFWEVIFHIVEDGRFVNRGTLHGPWLPIYGSGGLMVLMILNKLREKPVISFLCSILLCGVVEYITGLVLEFLYHEKWWDYTGYYMNINGRVCAEGLLFFGIGSVAIIYFIAPILDNFLRKLRLRILIPVCAVLVMVFIGDSIYSSFYPNIGKGITDQKIPIIYENIYDTEKSFI